MSERGFFAIDRGVWDHPLFAREKFSEREAWFWLISSAAWEPIRVRIGRTCFDLERGQCVFSLRFLATKWMWSEPRVRRFLNRLSDDAAVLVLATREATHLTICKYNDYQLSRRTDVAASDAPVDEKSTNPRRKEEEINNLTNKQTTIDQSARKRGARLPDEWMPSVEDQSEAERKLGTPGTIEELKKFRDYWKAQPGQRGVKLDWDATFRNWIRNAKGPQANGRRTVHDAARDLHEETLRRIAAFDEPAPRGGLFDGTGEDVVRLLPARRRE